MDFKFICKSLYVDYLAICCSASTINHKEGKWQATINTNSFIKNNIHNNTNDNTTAAHFTKREEFNRNRPITDYSV